MTGTQEQASRDQSAIHGLPISSLAISSLDRIARVAARALRASMVIISIADDRGGQLEATTGLPNLRHDERQLGAARSFCSRVLDAGEMLAVGNFDADALPGDFPTPQAGACLGVPLCDPSGERLGALCIIDSLPRTWNAEDRALLTDLAALFESEVDLSAEIHRRRLAEETGELVTRELSHRIKNIFAVIASLVTVSVRGHPEARGFAKAVGDRISALARAHDYVRPEAGAAPALASAQSLLGLIAALMAPYEENGRARISVHGEDAPVGRLSVTTLALVLHELATNAVKYGALSLPSGTVSIMCEKTIDMLVLTWRELDGPEIAGPPVQHGFGTILSERAATTQLGAEIRHDWRQDGLELIMRIPLQRLAL